MFWGSRYCLGWGSEYLVSGAKGVIELFEDDVADAAAYFHMDGRLVVRVNRVVVLAIAAFGQVARLDAADAAGRIDHSAGFARQADMRFTDTTVELNIDVLRITVGHAERQIAGAHIDFR